MLDGTLLWRIPTLVFGGAPRLRPNAKRDGTRLIASSYSSSRGTTQQGNVWTTQIRPQQGPQSPASPNPGTTVVHIRARRLFARLLRKWLPRSRLVHRTKCRDGLLLHKFSVWFRTSFVCTEGGGFSKAQTPKARQKEHSASLVRKDRSHKYCVS